MPRSHRLRHPHRRRDIDAGRRANRQPLMDQHIVDIAQRLSIRDTFGIVDRGAVEVGGNAALTDALGDRRARHRQIAVLYPAVETAALGVREHDANRRVFLLQRHRDAGQRAAGAAGAGKGVDLAAGLFPDLRAGGQAVTLPISQIVELVGPNGAHLLGQPAGVMHVIPRIAVGLGRHQAQVGTDHPQKIDFFLALCFRHHDHAFVAQRVADQREADAGIPRGAFHDRAAGL